MWTQYLLWYWKTAQDPWVSLEELLCNAPIIVTDWNRKESKIELIRFGTMWKCYDMVFELVKQQKVPCALDEHCGQPGYLLGGYSGRDFLVLSSGLEQPAARKGVVKYLSEPSNKTLGVAERQFYVAYCRNSKDGLLLWQ